MPYESTNEDHLVKTTFAVSNSAFIVMDPWDNLPSKFLNEHFGKVMNQFLLPLIEKAAEKKFQVYVFTNNCKKCTSPYSCGVHEKIEELLKKHSNLHILYWDEFKKDEFVSSLKEKRISQLIYTGFASNLCVIGRPSGIIAMKNEGFKTFFVPQASAALETKHTWKKGKIHKYTTTILAQGLAGIINLKDLDEALEKLKTD
ncbi:isochorismatase family protein [Candidatus Paracaedibacter symbiosus]|uniref:isochorismatase family protein n=1 Tax=Candidatus Paracaedibacter symbiosus TaxID=244582 RepID=UPI000509D312|nr:isochorismatase family protein [Candidatus Paracaedibacter symbiosus]